MWQNLSHTGLGIDPESTLFFVVAMKVSFSQNLLSYQELEFKSWTGFKIDWRCCRGKMVVSLDIKFLPFVPSKACRGSILSLEYLFASVLIWGLLKVSQIFKLLGLSQNIDRRTRKGSLNIKIWHVFLRLDEVVLKTMHHSCPVCTWNHPSATFLFDKASLPFWSAGLV